MHSLKDIHAILGNWDIPQDLPLGDIWIMDGAQVSGHVWKLGDDYVLKSGPRDKMLKNIRMTKALAAQGFTASELVHTTSGAEYVEDHLRIFTLNNSLPGAPPSKEERFGPNRREFGFKCGQGIAKLHAALKKVEPHIMPNEGSLYKQVTEWALPNVQKQNQQWDMGLEDSFFEDYIETFGKLFPHLPKQLIHRDLHPSNMLFHEGEVSGFIDFDFSEKCVRIRDLCYFSTGLLAEWRGVDDIQEKWPLVLEGAIHGYDSVNPLTPEEKQAVFYVLCSIQMICIAYFESIEEFQGLAKTNREMLQFIAKSKAQIQAVI